MPLKVLQGDLHGKDHRVLGGMRAGKEMDLPGNPDSINSEETAGNVKKIQ